MNEYAGRNEVGGVCQNREGRQPHGSSKITLYLLRYCPAKTTSETESTHNNQIKMKCVHKMNERIESLSRVKRFRLSFSLMKMNM
jgi:hypothetical protein